MEAPWNLCNPLPAAEPVLMDSLEGSPRSVSHIKGEVTHFAAQRRSSAPFENPYARQQPQYSVQGSTSTPNSVGPSSGSVSPDGSTQQTDSNGVLIEWMKPTDDNESYDITYAQPSDVKPRYCYVVHGQHPATLPRNELFNPSILPPNCTSSTAPRPVHLVFGMSPSASLHFSPPSTQRSTSVPRQIGDHSHPAVVKINTSAAPKATKRKSSQEPNRPPKKPAVPRDSTPKQAPKSGISALTRRRLRIAQRPGEMMPRARLPLTELTVEDLKTLCRKRNFPISGTKADLYKRLQPIEDQLDIEAMLLEAIEEEDLRMAEANAGSDEAGVKSTCSEATATAYTVATALLPQERRPSSQSGVNQFDVAISDYLMQHQKQLNQQRSSQRPISIENTCTWTTSSSCSIRKLGEKPPLTHIQPLVRLVPRKPNESEEGKQNGSTFHYAEMGSGGQFTLEPTAKNVSSTTIRSGNVVKFIADPAIFRPPPVAAPPKRPVEACCEKCTERQTNTTTDGNTEELHKLIKELTVSPVNASTDNPSLTAKILALHERVLSVQTTKLRAMATAIADSQKTLQCQQRLIKDVRREAKKVHSEQPSPLESLVRTVDVLELEKQHAKQTDELRKLQQSHQRMKNEQEALGRSEMELQEEIHVEQAVEDVARLIRTNRRTALLIVQLVHKFQCDRMRELDQSQSAAPLRRVPAAAANAAAISQEKKCSSATCSPNVACGCARRPPPRSADPAIVVIDESDEEETPIEKTSPQATPKAVETTAAKRKTKTKTASKKSPKIAVQRSEHTFSKIMEDIFQTVISERDEQEAVDAFDLNDNSTANHTPVVVEMPKEEDGDEHSKKKELELSYAYSSKPVETQEMEIIPASYPPTDGIRRLPMQIEPLSVHHDHSPFAFNNNTQLMVQKIDEQMMNACAEIEHQTAAADYHDRLADAEVRAVGTNSYYHRRALLQQKRQTLCEQLEQIERQQRRHELQNPFGSTCEMNVGEDELGCGLGDLNVDELYNCDFEQYEMSGTESSLHTPVPMSTEVTTKMDTSFTAAFHSMPMQMSAHSADVYKQHPHHPPPSYCSPHTFPHMHSNDFEDILDLIHNGDNKWDGEPTGHVETITSEQQPTTSDSECVQATNAIYQDLRQTDNQFQLFTPMPELDGMTWNDSMVVETPKTAVYGECGL